MLKTVLKAVSRNSAADPLMRRLGALGGGSHRSRDTVEREEIEALFRDDLRTYPLHS